jgi:UPF0755 protein
MKWILRGFLVLVLVAVLAVAGGGLWMWQELSTQTVHTHSGDIEIPTGFSPDAAIARLADNGIIKQTVPLRIYMKLTGAGKLIKAGVYKFNSPISPLQTLQRLEQGGEALGRITVIEGWTKWDVANALARNPKLHFKDSAAALNLLNDTTEIKDIAPSARSLEGFLYPDTYFIDVHTTDQGLVSQMVSRFRRVWKERLEARAKSAGLTAEQVVTMASLIETEAKLPGDRQLVSSVIYNRLKKGIPLALDSTIVYASKEAGKWRYDGKVYQSDIDRKSPYNTRQVKGLPPGPIGAPGLSCLEAALSPANTTYIYYVRNPDRNDGAHNFYSDAASFEVGVQALRNWERQRDLRAAAAARSQLKQPTIGLQHHTSASKPVTKSVSTKTPPARKPVANAAKKANATKASKAPSTSKKTQGTAKSKGGNKPKANSHKGKSR